MNIDGITVLSQKLEEVAVTGDFTWNIISILLFICAGLAFVGCAGLGTYLILKDKGISAFLLALPFSIGISFLIISGVETGSTTTTYEVNTYSVTITDDVSFREVVDNYNLISRDGEIFVLQEKGSET